MYLLSFYLISDLLWALSNFPKYVFCLSFQFSEIFILHFSAWITAFNSEMALHLFGGHTDGVLMMSTVYLITWNQWIWYFTWQRDFSYVMKFHILCWEIILGYLGGQGSLKVEDGERSVSVRMSSVRKAWLDWSLLALKLEWVRRQGMWAVSPNWKRHEKFSRASGKEHSPANTLI